MKNQILKSFTAAAVFAALALFAAAAGEARAQSPVHIRVQIPFDFYVGDRLLAAGEYTVRRAAAGTNNTLVFAGGGERAARQTSAVETGREADATKLVFHRYADQYFLARLWTVGERAGREFRPSKRERSIRAEGARVAARGGNASDMKPVVVEVAAGGN